MANLSPELQKCNEILEKLRSDQLLEAFKEPVPWEDLGLFDYPQKIKQPMDLETVHNKLIANKYKVPRDFANDIRLIWKNCMEYNVEESDLYRVAKRTSAIFERKFKAAFEDAAAKKKSMEAGSVAGSHLASAKKKRKSAAVTSAPSQTLGTLESDKLKGVSVDMKAEFCRLLFQLTERELGEVIELLEKLCRASLIKKWKNQEEDYGEEEIEINIDLIDFDSFKQAYALIRSKIQKTQMNGTRYGVASSTTAFTPGIPQQPPQNQVYGESLPLQSFHSMQMGMGADEMKMMPQNNPAQSNNGYPMSVNPGYQPPNPNNY